MPRPLNFGLLLFVLAIILMQDGFENLQSRKCWWLPLLSLLWANLHGGSIPILFAFNGMFLVLSLLPKYSVKGIGQTAERNMKRIKRFAFLLVADMAAAMVNPYGWRLFIYFFHTNSEATKKYISEWQPAQLLNLAAIAAIIIIMMLLIVRREDKVLELRYVLPVAATYFMTGKYVRIEPYLLLCVIMLFWHGIHEQHGDYIPQKLNSLSVKKLTVMLVATAIPLAVLACAAVQDMVGAPGDRKGDPVTAELIEYLEEKKPQRMYTTYDDGGYLIYHGYKSFIDSRADLFPGEMLERAIEFESMISVTSEEIENYIDEYAFDAILLSHNERLCVWLEMNAKWEKTYSDDHFELFELVQT